MAGLTAAAEKVSLKVPATMKSLIEALIFAADEPLTVKELKAIYEEQNPAGEGRHLEQGDVQQIVQELNEEYQKATKPYRIIAIAGGYQFATMTEYAEWIGRLYREQSRRKLSHSSLETLAIVAYKQPVSKPEVEAIRGVNCDYVLRTLLEKDLVTIVGRAESVGRPLLYGTTREFLKHFGLNEVTDLPRPREIEEILGESQFETERRMLEAQEGADQTKKEADEFKSRLPHIPKKKAEMDETVQIIPKKRGRRINVRAHEEHEGAERTERTPQVREGVEAPAMEIQNSVEEVEDAVKSTQEALEPADGMEAHVARDPEVPAVIPAQSAALNDSGLASENQSRDFVEVPPPVYFPHIGPGQEAREPEMTQPRKRTWSQWKEKIRSFIRKLFG